jgi:hypothetical protein
MERLKNLRKKGTAGHKENAVHPGGNILLSNGIMAIGNDAQSEYWRFIKPA